MTFTQKLTLIVSTSILLVIFILLTQSTTSPKHEYKQNTPQAEVNETKAFLQGTIDSH